MTSKPGFDRNNEKDEKKKEMRKTPESNPRTGSGSRHEEKAPGRHPAPTRPANEPLRDPPEDDDQPEGDIERGRPDRNER